MYKYLAFLIIISTLVSCQDKTYIKNAGPVFGTSYHFTYESLNGDDHESEIMKELKSFNKSLSTYDPNSTISKVNKNDTNVIIDNYFLSCWKKAEEIFLLTDGAFDITVAPVVNAWGFGFKEGIQVDSNLIDSLMQFVGFNKIKLIDGHIIKEYQGTMLDASAIAKGYGVDVVANFLESKGIKNYMVEIGGEVRARGKNEKNNYWRIGIDKPIDDVTAMNRQLEAVVSLDNKSLATSGNYRQFYIKDGIKYAHTINPKTGYSALSNLLSATVLANNCITADAMATAFMVLGLEKSIELSKTLKNIEVFFIYVDSNNEYKTYSSMGLEDIVRKLE